MFVIHSIQTRSIFGVFVPWYVTPEFNCRYFSAPLAFDVVVVGGGIVGCATARQLSIAKPHLKIAVVEKEEKLGEPSSIQERTIFMYTHLVSINALSDNRVC